MCQYSVVALGEDGKETPVAANISAIEVNEEGGLTIQTLFEEAGHVPAARIRKVDCLAGKIVIEHQ
ncbi:MAG: CooT family nickel-binding protein [Thermodesulfobacteriota bacterium]